MNAKQFFRNSTVLVSVTLFVACASTIIDLPAVTDTPASSRLPGKVIWHDLLTNDADASKRFYGTLFGWVFEDVGDSVGLSGNSTYSLIRHNGNLIGGMIDTVALNQRDDISQWVVLVSVDDVEAATEKFAASGGEVITPPTDVRRRGKLAVVRDSQGALLGLLQTLNGDPADSEPQVNEFLWDELWTTDVDKATAFYQDVTGLESRDWDVDDDQTSNASYRILKSGDVPRVGIMPNPLDGLSPVWVSYIRVEDPAAVAAKVDALGGRVIVEAQKRPLGGEVAFVAGPSGAGIALQTWPLKDEN
jgi:predicted enzyme related to lactoylglutathione lyase